MDGKHWLGSDELNPEATPAPPTAVLNQLPIKFGSHVETATAK